MAATERVPSSPDEKVRLTLLTTRAEMDVPGESNIVVRAGKASFAKEPAVAQFLVQLPTMGNKELRQHWRELFGRDPRPGMRRNHMIPILAYRAQEMAFGGLKESTVRMLRELALGIASEAQAAYRPKTGTRYVREHNGKLHEVTVLDDGFEYEGESYRSLTEIAKVITGTKWSGPAFFGLKRKKLTE
jgi:hypothetical protein